MIDAVVRTVLLAFGITQEQTNAFVLLAVFLAYMVGLLLTAWRLIWLYVGYKLGFGINVGRPFPFARVVRIERAEPPLLLLVLVVFILSIAWPWVLLFGVRVGQQVFGWDTGALSGNTLWYLITGAPPAAGVLWFTWITYRRIGRAKTRASDKDKWGLPPVNAPRMRGRGVGTPRD